MTGSDSAAIALPFPFFVHDTLTVWGYRWCLDPLELPDVQEVEKFGRAGVETPW